MMMNGRLNQIVFHHSVMGIAHERKSLPCQDASASFAPKEGSVRIAAVADGHGDATCLRSDRGSSFAVSVAVECLREFGMYYPDMASIEGDSRFSTSSAECLRQLTDAIVSRWSAMTRQDIEADKLSEDEYSGAGSFEAQYRRGEHLERIYGCTLIAALEAGDYLLLLQQGDGRCDILREDGAVEQPIPEDERCYGNVTTSMSDDFAAREIRSVLLSGRDAEFVACFLSSDGIDNGFYDESSMLQFYLDVGGKLAETAEEDYPQLLDPLLSSVSLHGNGDDVSLAGFIDSEGLKASEQIYRAKIQKSQKEGAKVQLESKLISMERKMEILMGQVRNASPEERQRHMKEYMEYRLQYNQVKSKAQELAKE